MQRYLVIYTQSARDDVNAIAEHIRLAADDAIAARFTGRIIAAVEKLAVLPLSQRIRPELGPEFRAVRVGQYMIFYRVEQSTVAIVRVLHGARRITKELFQS